MLVWNVRVKSIITHSGGIPFKWEGLVCIAATIWWGITPLAPHFNGPTLHTVSVAKTYKFQAAVMKTLW